MQQRRPVRRALLSVSDNAGIVEFAQAHSARGVELLSTGGTARLLAEKGLPVTEVSDYTGFPEMMDGRVKTLHPKVHGGILGRRGQDDAIMEEHQIQPIDMVVVNLYPFAQTVAREGCSLEDAVENIDIGGPPMVRSAAKNHKDVAIVVKSSDYDAIIKEIDANEGSLTLETRFDLAIKAFEHTAAKQNVRVLTCGQWGERVPGLDFKRVNGGLLVQDRDLGMVGAEELRVVTKRQPTEQELRDALFCWKVAKFVKSNAIVYAKNNMTIGIGAGQMSRVYSAKIAGIKAADEGLEVKGSSMASDAFFPFRDGIDAAAAAGVTCVIQPGGSIRDDEVIAAADEHGIAMLFTDMRHFRH